MQSNSPPDVMVWLRLFRQRMLNILLSVVVLLGGAAIVITFLPIVLAGRFRVNFLFVYYLSSFLIALVLLLWRNLPDRWRAAGFLSLLYVFSVLALVSGWLGGGGRSFLLAMIVLAAVLIGPWAGIIAVGLSILTMIVFGWLYWQGLLFYSLAPQYSNPVIIIPEILGFAMAAGMLSIALWFFKAGLEAATTAMEQAQRSRQLLDDRARQLDTANRELEAFSYSVSHDLRAPLRAINGYSNILRDDHAGVLGDEATALLEKISTSGQKMGLLIDNLLDFSRLSRKPLQKSNVNLNDVVLDVLDLMSFAVEGRDVFFDLHPLPDANADRELIMQVYSNLVGNAVKYTRNQPKAIIEIGSYNSDAGLVYFVRDNGVGFDMHYIDKLFGVFQRLHSDAEFEGTGIGLATVRRIVERHGGRVWAESFPGGGASFYFTLP